MDACGPAVIPVIVVGAILLSDNCGPGPGKLHSSCAGR